MLRVPQQLRSHPAAHAYSQLCSKAGLLQLKHMLHDVTLATVSGGQLENKSVRNITSKVRFQTILVFESVHDGNHGSLVILCAPLPSAQIFCIYSTQIKIHTRSITKFDIFLNSLGPKFSSQGHFHSLQLLNVSQFLFSWLVRLKTAPRGNFSHA